MNSKRSSLNIINNNHWERIYILSTSSKPLWVLRDGNSYSLLIDILKAAGKNGKFEHFFLFTRTIAVSCRARWNWVSSESTRRELNFNLQTSQSPLSEGATWSISVYKYFLRCISRDDDDFNGPHYPVTAEQQAGIGIFIAMKVSCLSSIKITF